jgi:hypothetical protein
MGLCKEVTERGALESEREQMPDRMPNYRAISIWLMRSVTTKENMRAMVHSPEESMMKVPSIRRWNLFLMNADLNVMAHVLFMACLKMIMVDESSL